MIAGAIPAWLWTMCPHDAILHLKYLKSPMCLLTSTTGGADVSKKVGVVAAWDDDAGRGREQSERLGIEFVADLDALLARPDVDAVTIWF